MKFKILKRPIFDFGIFNETSSWGLQLNLHYSFIKDFKGIFDELKLNSWNDDSMQRWCCHIKPNVLKLVFWIRIQNLTYKTF